MKTFAFLLVAISFFRASLAAQEFRVSTPDWRGRNLRLVQLDGDGVVHFSGKEDKTFPTSDLIELRREGAPLPERPAPPYLLLTSGETIPLDPSSKVVWKETRLEATARGHSSGKSGTPLSVPLAYLGMAYFDHPHADEDAEIVRRKLLESKRRTDVILLTNGDQIEGKVVHRDTAKWKVRAGDRDVELETARIALVAINPERLIFPRTKKIYFRLVSMQGVSIDALTLKLDSAKQSLVGKSPAGISFEMALKDLVMLEARQGRSVFLSDLFGLRYRSDDPFTTGTSLARNRTLTYRPLRLKDGLHEKGLSMSAQDSVEVDLKGAYRLLEGQVGMDRRDGLLGRVRLEVLLDGKKADLGIEGELTAESEVLSLRLNVAGVRSLTLATLPGSRVGVQNVVNWGSLRLVK